MEMRDRLIELISTTTVGIVDGAVSTIGSRFTPSFIKDIADHLLASGIIVPPCKVGDKIYKLLDDEVIGGWSVFAITTYKSTFVITDDCGFRYANDEIGEEIFLTKEEAEAKLKEMKGNE